MGLFGFKQQRPPPPADPRERFRAIGSFDIPEEKRLELMREALAEIGLGITGQSIVNITDGLELRGVRGETPVRISLPSGFWIKVEMLVELHCPIYRLSYDPERTPAQDQQLDPLWDDMDERGVFLAPGVFFQGEDADRTAAAFLKLPPDFVHRIVTDMQTLNLLGLTLQSKSCLLLFRNGPKDILDLVGTVRSGMALLETASAVLGGADPEARHLPKHHSVAPLRCHYCHGWFFPLNEDLHCRNCGAPYDVGEEPAGRENWG